MGKNTKTYSEPRLSLSGPAKAARGESDVQELFSISSYTLNMVEVEDDTYIPFPGNIAPEGYFYSPFYEVTLKELTDDLQTIYTKRINFVPSANTTYLRTETVTFYDTEMGVFEDRTMYVICIASPVTYDFLPGQPFSIYDIQEELTYRGHLSAATIASNGSCQLEIALETPIDSTGLCGQATGASGRSRYIVSALEENAPTYAEYIPESGKLVWRGPKKMSDLTSESPIYNMPFTNGRLYIHHNVNVFVRRQDPHGDYMLYHPSNKNPLRRYQIEGDAKLDLDYIQYIIDSMVDAC